mgnify:CR=1 FL=1
MQTSCLSSFFSVLQGKQKQNVELCTMAASNGLKNLQRSDIKCWGERSSMRKIKEHFVMNKNLRMRESKICTKREREIGTKNTLYSKRQQQQQQPLLEVTKSLYIVTHLGQLPFMLFIEIARTWVVQRDSVNTAVIHSYSTRKAQICEACQLGKQHRIPFPNERNRSRNKLDLIHSDVWGPAQNVSLGGVDISSPSSTTIHGTRASIS